MILFLTTPQANVSSRDSSGKREQESESYVTLTNGRE